MSLIKAQVECADAFRILVVDDNVELRELLQQILSRKYLVESAEDGDAALAMIREPGGFDLLITDLKMPNTNGIQLIQSLPERMSTIIVSGFLDQEEFRGQIEALEPLAVFQKPFKMAELRESIEKAREARSAECETGKEEASPPPSQSA